MTGVLTGIYMLLSGAIANYLAGVIADQTAQGAFLMKPVRPATPLMPISTCSAKSGGFSLYVGLVLIIWLYHALRRSGPRPGRGVKAFTGGLPGRQRLQSRLFGDRPADADSFRLTLCLSAQIHG